MVLKGLISSLLHLAPEEVGSVIIMNPIELGAAIDDKTFILDVRVSLNSSAVINLEMQVINEHNWVERSLSYLCRNFDQLKSGESYQQIRPVVQIGILNFTLFPGQPEFYATYKFLNVKNYTLYSDKLRLSVLDLTCIGIATEEDKEHQIDCWASLFKASTWEELNMLAQNNEYINEASETIYHLSQEEKIRQQCEAREDYYRRQKDIQLMFESQRNELADQKLKIAEQGQKITEQERTIAELRKALAEQAKAAR